LHCTASSAISGRGARDPCPKRPPACTEGRERGRCRSRLAGRLMPVPDGVGNQRAHSGQRTCPPGPTIFAQASARPRAPAARAAPLKSDGRGNPGSSWCRAGPRESDGPCPTGSETRRLIPPSGHTFQDPPSSHRPRSPAKPHALPRSPPRSQGCRPAACLLPELFIEDHDTRIVKLDTIKTTARGESFRGRWGKRLSRRAARSRDRRGLGPSGGA
jgi:hypothetical protein